MAGTAEGSFDTLVGLIASGWVRDPQRPDESVLVQVREGDRVLAEGMADGFRDDLLAAGIGHGRHAFRIELPETLRDGHRHEVTVVVAPGGAALHGGPKTLGPLEPADPAERFAFLIDDFRAIEARQPRTHPGR